MQKTINQYDQNKFVPYIMMENNENQQIIEEKTNEIIKKKVGFLGCMSCMNSKLVQDSKKLTGLPSWIQVDKLSKQLTTNYKLKAHEINKSIEKYNEEDVKFTIRKNIQWFKNNELLINISISDPQKKQQMLLIQSLNYFLEAFKEMLEERPSVADNSVLAEIIRYNLMVVYSLQEDKKSSVKINELDRQIWKESIMEIEKMIEQIDDVPTNILEYEVDMLRRGIEIMPTGENQLMSLISSGIKGGIKALQGDVGPLLNTLVKSANVLASSLISKYSGQPFQLAIQLEQFKRNLLLNKLKLNNSLIISHKISQENDPQQLLKLQNMREDDPDAIINLIMQSMIQFETDIIKNSKDFRISYLWVKIIEEMILYNCILVDQQLLDDLLKQSMIVKKVTLNELLKYEWISQLSDQYYLVNNVMPGQLSSLTPKQNQIFKKQINNKKSEITSLKLQEFLYFGNKQFHGLQTYLTTGSEQSQSLFSKFDIIQTTFESVNIFEINFDKLNPLEIFNKIIHGVIDQSMIQIIKELEKSYIQLGSQVDNKFNDYFNSDNFISLIEQNIINYDKNSLNQGQQSRIKKQLEFQISAIIRNQQIDFKKIQESYNINMKLKNYFDNGLNQIIECFQKLQSILCKLIDIELDTKKINQSLELFFDYQIIQGIDLIIETMETNFIFIEEINLTQELQVQNDQTTKSDQEIEVKIAELLNYFIKCINRNLNSKIVCYIDQIQRINKQINQNYDNQTQLYIYDINQIFCKLQKDFLIALQYYQNYKKIINKKIDQIFILLEFQIKQIINYFEFINFYFDENKQNLIKNYLEKLQSLQLNTLSIKQLFIKNELFQEIDILYDQINSNIGLLNKETIKNQFQNKNKSEFLKEFLDKVLIDLKQKLDDFNNKNYDNLVKSISSLMNIQIQQLKDNLQEKNLNQMIQSLNDDEESVFKSQNLFEFLNNDIKKLLQEINSFLCEYKIKFIDKQNKINQSNSEIGQTFQAISTFTDDNQKKVLNIIEEMEINESVNSFDQKFKMLLSSINELIYEQYINCRIKNQLKYLFEDITLNLKMLNEDFLNMGKDICNNIEQVEEFVKEKIGFNLKENIDLTQFTEAIEFTKNLKTYMIQQVEDTIRKLCKTSEETIKQFGAEFICKAEELSGFVDQEVKDKFMKFLGGALANESWKVRERALMSIMLILEQRESVNEKIINDIEQQIVKRKSKETEPRVRLLLDNQAYVQEMASILKGNWDKNSTDLKDQILEGMRCLDDLQKKIIQQPQEQVRELLVIKSQMIQDEFDKQINNMTNMQQLMGIQIQFLKAIKQQLFELQNTLNTVAKDVVEIKNDIKYLLGKTIPELLDLRYQQLNNDSYFDKINIKINAEYSEGLVKNGKEIKVGQIVNDFMKNEKQNTLLIHGISGSGKTTLTRFIERKYLKIWKKKGKQQNNNYEKEADNIIPIWCQLGNLRQPLQSLVQDTLKYNYGFDEKRIQQLKDLSQTGEYKLVFIMDAYDEINQEFQFKNLYDSNDLEQWGPQINPDILDSYKSYPKIIITCREEHLETYQNYQNLFYPVISNTSKSVYNFQNYYVECGLSHFLSKKNEYFNSYYLYKLKRILQNSLNVSRNSPLLSELFDSIVKQLIPLSQQKSSNTITHRRSRSVDISLSQKLNDDQIHSLYLKLQTDSEAVDNFIDQNQHFNEVSDKLRAFFKDERVLSLWYPQQFENNISQLLEFLETPYMIKVIIKVLPSINSQQLNPNFFKSKFMQNFQKNINIFNIYWKILADHLYQTNLEINECDDKVKGEIQSLVLTKETLDKYYMEIIDELVNFVRENKNEDFEESDQHMVISAIQKCFQPTQIIRHQLYDRFTNYLLNKEIKIISTRTLHQGVNAKDLRHDLQKFSQHLSIQMAKSGTNHVIYNQEGNMFRLKNEWDQFFYIDNQQKKEIIDSSPIYSTGNCWQFYHKSLQEFFFAQYICQIYSQPTSFATRYHVIDLINIFFKELKMIDKLDNTNQQSDFQNIQQNINKQQSKIKESVDLTQLIKKETQKTQIKKKSLKQILIDLDYREQFWKQSKSSKKYDEIQKTSIKQIYQDLLVFIEKLVRFKLDSQILQEKQDIMNYFLIQKVQQDNGLNNMLHITIHLSRLNKYIKEIDFKNEIKNDGIEHAASFAISLLNMAGQSFSNSDFSHVKIPKANLSNGVFHFTDFKGANLNGVNFSQSYLVKCKLNTKEMENIQIYASNEQKIDQIDLKQVQFKTELKTMQIKNQQTKKIKSEQCIFTINNNKLIYIPIISKSEGNQIDIGIQKLFFDNLEDHHSIVYSIKNDFHSKRVIVVGNFYDFKKLIRYIGLQKFYYNQDQENPIQDQNLCFPIKEESDLSFNINYTWNHQIKCDEFNIIYAEKNQIYIYHNQKQKNKKNLLIIDDENYPIEIQVIELADKKLFILDQNGNIISYNYDKQSRKISEKLKDKQIIKIKQFPNYKIIRMMFSNNKDLRIILEYNKMEEKAEEKQEKHLMLYEIQSKQNIFLKGLKNDIELLEFSRDENKKIIGVCKDKIIYVWFLKNLNKYLNFKSHTTQIIAINFSGCFNFVYSLDKNGTLKCNDITKMNKETLQQQFHKNTIQSIKFSPDNLFIISNDLVTQIYWDTFGNYVKTVPCSTGLSVFLSAKKGYQLEEKLCRNPLLQQIQSCLIINNYFDDNYQLLTKEQWNSKKRYKKLIISFENAYRSNKKFQQFCNLLFKIIMDARILTFSFNMDKIIWYNDQDQKIIFEDLKSQQYDDHIENLNEEQIYEQYEKNKNYRASIQFNFFLIQDIQIDFFGETILIVLRDKTVQRLEIKKIWIPNNLFKYEIQNQNSNQQQDQVKESIMSMQQSEMMQNGLFNFQNQNLNYKSTKTSVIGDQNKQQLDQQIQLYENNEQFQMQKEISQNDKQILQLTELQDEKKQEEEQFDISKIMQSGFHNIELINENEEQQYQQEKGILKVQIMNFIHRIETNIIYDDINSIIDDEDRIKEIELDLNSLNDPLYKCYKDKNYLFMVQIIKKFKLVREFIMLGHTNDILLFQLTKDGSKMVSLDKDGNFMLWRQQEYRDGYYRWSLKIRWGQFDQNFFQGSHQENLVLDHIDYKNNHDGSKYHELFQVNGVKYAICEQQNGTIYEGYFKNDYYHGKGKLVKVIQDKNNTNHLIVNQQIGKMQNNNTETYKGEFNYGQREGYGEQWKIDFYYKGNWKEDKKSGYGEIYFDSGKIYKGNFKKGLFNGQGELIDIDQSVYNGQFKNSKKDGLGIIYYADGSIYEGEFKNDQKQGLGCLKYADGIEQKEFWLNGQCTIQNEENSEEISQFNKRLHTQQEEEDQEEDDDDKKEQDQDQDQEQ